MATRIQVRRDLKANWSSSLVLASGEIAYETDTGNVKIGDGTTQWSSLEYIAIGALSSIQTDLNDADYLKQGRFYLNTASGSWTNLPSDMTAADGESLLFVTLHLESSTAWYMQHLVQFVTSGSETKSWERVYDSGAAAYSAWRSKAHLSPNEVVTSTIADLNVTTAKIADLNVTTGKIADNAVTDAKIRDSAAVSVIGRSANSSGDPADIAAGSNDTLFRRVSDALSFGQLTNGMVPTNTVGLDKLVNMAASGLLGNTAAGAVTALTPAQVYAQINNSGFVHTDNTKVGCIGLAFAQTGGLTSEYPTGSFTTTVVGSTRYVRSTAGTWRMFALAFNSSGLVITAQVLDISTTSTNLSPGNNLAIAIGVRTA